jgi:hypothetical protein
VVTAWEGGDLTGQCEKRGDHGRATTTLAGKTFDLIRGREPLPPLEVPIDIARETAQR